MNRNGQPASSYAKKNEKANNSNNQQISKSARGSIWLRLQVTELFFVS